MSNDHVHPVMKNILEAHDIAPSSKTKTLSDLEAWIASDHGRVYSCTRQYPHPGYACEYRGATCVGCLIVAAALELRKAPSPVVTPAKRSVESLVTWPGDHDAKSPVPVQPVLGTEQEITDKSLEFLIRFARNSNDYLALVELWERRGPVRSPQKASEQPNMDAGGAR